MTLTSKQEKFAQLLGTSSITQSDAYRQSYSAKNMDDKTIWEEASRMAADPKVHARIAQLKAEYQTHLKYDAEAHFRELEELKQLALVPRGKDGDVDVKASIKATELKGKLVGLYTEKTELTIPQGISVKIVTGGN